MTGLPYALQTRGLHVDSQGYIGIGTNASNETPYVRGVGAALQLQDDDDPDSYTEMEDAQPVWTDRCRCGREAARRHRRAGRSLQVGARTSLVAVKLASYMSGNARGPRRCAGLILLQGRFRQPSHYGHEVSAAGIAQLSTVPG